MPISANLIQLIVWGIVMFAGLVYLASAIQVVRPTEVRLVERFGKYVRTLEQGLHFAIPFVDVVHPVNITETMIEIDPQIIITKDKLNVEVDAVIYHRVVDAQAATYKVHDYESQVDMLASTLLRSVISKMTMTEANEQRDIINDQLKTAMDIETAHYGVDVMRVEIQAIKPPEDVVHAMNEVIKAEQAKLAATETAKALETRADGERMATIKIAEGRASARKLESEAEAKAIEVVNNAITEGFSDKARDFKALDVLRETMKTNTKIIIPPGSNLLNVMGDLVGLK